MTPRRTNAAVIPRLVCSGLLVLAVGTARGTTLALPAAGDRVVGEIKHAVVAPEDTLLDIARRYDLGVDEMVAANPGVDPWLPKPGTQVIVPSQYVLPDTPREGIVVNLPEMRLYYYPPPRPGHPPAVVTYPLGIGSEGNTLPLGSTKVIEKIKNPPWVVPESILMEHVADGRPLPKVVPPGPDNPLGNYALRLGWPTYLIHGTNRPYGIGMRVSHGCLRLYPEDIKALFEQVTVGTPVRIIDQPYKAGWKAGKLYLEAHAPLNDVNGGTATDLTGAVASVLAVTKQPLNDDTWTDVANIATAQRGFPVTVTVPPEQQAAAPAASAYSNDPPLPEGMQYPGWFVQIGAFKEGTSVRRVITQIAELHMQLINDATRDTSLCRILVGPFASRDQAAATLPTLRRATGMKGIIYPTRHYKIYQPCD